MLVAAVLLFFFADTARTSADALFHAGRYPEAALGYIALLRKTPNDPDLLEAAGRSFLALAAPERAIPFFQRELALRPLDLDAARSLSEALIAAGRFEEAHELLARITASDPSDGRSWGRLGALLYRNGYYPAAIDAFDRAIKPGTDNNQDEVLRAISLVESGSTAEAAKAIPGLLARPGNTANLDLRLSFVRLLYETGRDGEALQETDRALAKAPGNAAAHLWRARLLHRQDMNAQAVSEAEKARDLAPSSPAPHSLLVRLYEKSGRITDADREAAWLREQQAAVAREPQ